ncbi:alkane 1-monooxygenase, partial [Escherichia coli]|nr:alkane 1-monooxygenase [Escherichia coli]
QQAFVNLRSGRPGKLPAPVENYMETLDPQAIGMLNHALSCAIVGSPETVKTGVEAFIRRTGADEIIVTAQIHDHAKRRRSFEILAGVRYEMAKAA